MFAEHDGNAACIGQTYMSNPTRECAAEALTRLGSMMEEGSLTTLQEVMVEMCRYLGDKSLILYMYLVTNKHD